MSVLPSTGLSFCLGARVDGPSCDNLFLVLENWIRCPRIGEPASSRGAAHFTVGCWAPRRVTKWDMF
jgi:hypothetical protein